MKITDNLHLENSGRYFRLVEKRIAKRRGLDTEVDHEPREFGTVYQALQHIVEADYDVDKDLLEQFKSIIEWIDKAKEDIKRDFRIEVKTVR